MVDTSTIFSVSAVSSLYGLVLPGVLDASIKWYILKKHTGKPSNVLSSMVYNQLTATSLMLLLGLTALIVSNPASNWQLPVICSGLLAVIIIIISLVLNRKTGPAFTKLLSRILKPLPSKSRKAIQKMLDQLSEFQTAGWQFHCKLLILNLVSIIISGIAIYILAAKAAGITVPPMVLVWQCAVVFILGRLPISFANLGVREATLVKTFAQYGVAVPQALLMSMIIFSNKILMSFIGAICQLYWTIQSHNNSTNAKLSQ